MAFTGEFWDAAKAERRGLLQAVVSREAFTAEIDAWVGRLAHKPAPAGHTEGDHSQVDDYRSGIRHRLLDQHGGVELAHRDQKEGMGSFLDKREPTFGRGES